MENFTGEGLLMVVSIIAFAILLGAVLLYTPQLIDIIIQSLEAGVA